MDKIEHFLLPEETNSLYEREAISSISLTKEVADKINEIVDAINTLSKTDLEWKQLQEGAIRKGVIYMKDNLINSLHDLLETLESNGYFDNTVSKYVSDLEKRIDNLLGSIQEGSTSLDTEVIDIRYGADQMTYKTAGESIRTQLFNIIAALNNENLLNSVGLFRGFYTLKENGDEYLEGGDGLALTGRDEVYSELKEVEPHSIYTFSYAGDSNFITDQLWLSVHFYDENQKFITRETTVASGESIKLTFNTKNYKYIRVNYRNYITGEAKLEKGIFSTLIPYILKGNFVDNHALNHKGFYSWNNDGLAHFYKESANNERSTSFIPCENNKELTLYYKYGLNGWLSVNFITKEGYFTLLNSSSEDWSQDINNGIDTTKNVVLRRIYNTTGKYTLEIPSEAYAVSFSLRTINLEHFAVFFDDIESYERKYYELLFDSFKTSENILNGYGDIPFTTSFEMKDIAHRGYSSAAPENTLSAYKKAHEKGFKYVECDVNFTKDNIAVLIHDNTIDRTSDGSGSLYDYTYSELLNYDFGSWKSNIFAGEKIPTFDEFIKLCKYLSLHPYIEIKGDTTITNEQLDILVDTVKKYGMIKNVTWICFEFSNLEYIKTQIPTARLGYVVGSLSTTIIDMTKTLFTGYNEVFVDTNSFDDVSLQYAIDNNIPVECYTYDSNSDILNLPEYVSGVTSNSTLASEVFKSEV